MSAPVRRGGRDVVVVGASAGGVEAVLGIAAALPVDFPAAVFVVVHCSPASRGLLAGLVARAGPLPAAMAVEGAPVEPGRIYVAPPDHHVLLREGHVHLSRGPRENNARPAVNPLFRTAASAYGDRVVGVVLSGNLDDGTAGLLAIAEAGGVTVVQDPAEALYPGMPSSAVESLRIDHVLPLGRIAAELDRLARTPYDGAVRENPNGGGGEMDWRGEYAEPGRASGVSCPECHGPLWEIDGGRVVEYGCLIGHRYSPDTLMEASAVRIEESMGISLRALEERVRMAERLAEWVRREGKDTSRADRRLREAEEARRMAGRMRALLESAPAENDAAAD